MKRWLYPVFDNLLAWKLKWPAWAGLFAYNKVISPVRTALDRPACAHYLTYGGVGCSSAALEALNTLPLEEARVAIHARLEACSEAFSGMAPEQIAQACDCLVRGCKPNC